MKKVVLALSALCLIAFTSCKEDAAKKIDDNKVAAAADRDAASSVYPVLTFEKTEHDFGEIIAKTPVETVFKYKNTGEAPLVITDIKSTCGCTVPEDWSREPLAPGEEGQFTVKFNGSGTNKVSKAITVTANTEKGREVVKITAFVKPDPNAPVKATPLSPVIK
jgi:ABC-type molybdate transport system substrate-binding protein